MKKIFQKELILHRLVKILFITMFALISFLLLFVNHYVNYATKKTFLASNFWLLLIDIVILSVMYMIWRKINPRVSGLLDSKAEHYILIASFLLLILQGVISYNIYFATGWDVGSYIIPTSKLLAVGDSLSSVNEYFSRYPNNSTLVWIFSELFKFKNSIPFYRGYNDLTIIIMINCVISNLTGILTFKTVKRLINAKWAVFSWLLYVMLIGFSPWMVITYSDSLALLFPILIVYIYMSSVKSKFIELKWFSIGLVSFLGYYIRPQTIIILIAIIIYEAWKAIISIHKLKLRSIGVVGAVILSFLLVNGLNQMIYVDTGLEVDENDVFGWTHFAMMGLNEERDGIYSDEDVVFSASFKTAEERKHANIDEVKNRLNEFTPSSFLRFATRKALVNYGDGTFAWSVEGGFYMETYEYQHSTLSPFLRSLYYYDGDHYIKTATIQHAIWIFVIISLIGLAFKNESESEESITVLMLSLIGLTLFEMIFEARARYLYIYTPIYITLAVVGFSRIMNRFQLKRKARQLQ